MQRHLVDRIAERAVGLRTGDGRRACDMGPLVTAAARHRVAGYVDARETAGATRGVNGGFNLGFPHNV